MAPVTIIGKMMSRINLNAILKIGNEPGLEDPFTFTQSPFPVNFMLPGSFIRCHAVVHNSDGDS